MSRKPQTKFDEAKKILGGRDPFVTRIIVFGALVWAQMCVTAMIFAPGDFERQLKMMGDPMMLMITSVVLGYAGFRTYDRHSERKFETMEKRGESEDDVDTKSDGEPDGEPDGETTTVKTTKTNTNGGRGD